MPDLFGYDRYEGLSRSAEISECGKYRYWLRRSWKHGGDGRVVCFVMLNPSTADALADDPTIRRCMGFAQAWGFSVLSVRNLYSFRATDPAGLRTAEDPIGPRGDANLLAAATADVVVAAWGVHAPEDRVAQALTLLRAKPLFCLGRTKHGHPRHPLYVRADAALVEYRVPKPEGAES